MERYGRISGLDRSFDIEYPDVDGWGGLGQASASGTLAMARPSGITEQPLDHTAVEWERRLPMSQVTFSIPDEILLALKATPEILAARIRIAAAVKLYEMGQLSSGAASQLAGVPRPYFLGH